MSTLYLPDQAAAFSPEFRRSISPQKAVKHRRFSEKKIPPNLPKFNAIYYNLITFI